MILKGFHECPWSSITSLIQFAALGPLICPYIDCGTGPETDRAPTVDEVLECGDAPK